MSERDGSQFGEKFADDNLLANPKVLWIAAIRSLQGRSLERDMLLGVLNSRIFHLQRKVEQLVRDDIENDEVIGRLIENVGDLKHVAGAMEEQIVELTKSLEREKQVSGELEFALSEVSKLNTNLTSSKAFRVGMLITWPARRLRSAMVAWFHSR